MSEIRSELDSNNKLWMFMSIDEERAYFSEVCDRIISNPRFYLDHLEELSVFRVSWFKYKAEAKMFTRTERFIK